MKTVFALISALSLSAFAVDPVYQWNFEKPDANSRYASMGKKVLILGKKIDKGGYKNSNGLLCAGRNSHQGSVPMDWKHYTVELKFKLDKPFDKKSRGLFNYEFWSWSRRSFRLKIDSAGRVEFFLQNTQGGKKDVPKVRFVMTSAPLKWETNRWYTLRAAASAGGKAVMWLDGKQIAAKENAPGLDILNDREKPEYKHFVRLGWDTSTPSLGYGTLNGVIDDLKLWDSFQEPEISAETVDADESRILEIGKKDAPVWSVPFYVEDKAGYAYGSKEKQDSKFINAAATASVSMDNENLYVVIKCPIPAGMQVEKGKEIWNSDHIEFFLRPDLTSPVYYQYCAGTDGKSVAYRYSSLLVVDKKFKSNAVFKVDTSKPELFTVSVTIPRKEAGCADLPEGTMMSGNFCRGGATSGGLSSWIPMNGNFHAPDAFGKLIVGGRKAYFAKELDAVEKQTSSADIRRKIENLRTRSKGKNFPMGVFDAVLANIKIDVMSEQLKGKKLLVWQSNNWDNNFSISAQPPVMVEKIRVIMAQNSRYMGGFTVSNLSDKNYMGQVKCFNYWPLRNPSKSFSRDDNWTDFQDGIRFYEAVPVETAGGNSMYDPMALLPMNTLLRIPAKGNAPLWFTISSKKLKPGMYKTNIVINPSYAGFKAEVIPLEVEVLPVDFGKVELDSFHYAFFSEYFIDAPYMRRVENLYQYLVDQETNILFGGHLREVYPEMNADGSIKPIDFTSIDRKIGAWIQAGIRPDRIKLMFNLNNDFTLCWRDKDGKIHSPRHKFNTPEFDRGFKEFMKEFYAHVGKKFNIPPERIIIYTGDEPEGDINNPKSRLFRAYHNGKLVKEVVPNASLVTNPYPRKGLNKAFIDAIAKLCEHHTHMILLPQAQIPELMKIFKDKKITVWTYEVLSNTVSPETYRRMFTRSFKRNIGSGNGYWAIDSYAGDQFNPHDFSGDYKGGYSKSRMDWGSMYCDLNQGTYLPGRRAEAHYQGLLDLKALTICRELIVKKADRQTWQKELDGIVKRLEEGTCQEMDKAHADLLRLILRLKN